MSDEQFDFEKFVEYINDLKNISIKYQDHSYFPGMKTIGCLIYLLHNYDEEQNLKNMDIIETISSYSKNCIENEGLEKKILLCNKNK